MASDISRTFILICSTALLGCASKGPENALQRVASAVEENDVGAFRANVSTRTLQYLREEHGEQETASLLAFMMNRMKSGLPLRMIAQDRSRNVAVLTVQGRDRKRTQLTFVRVDGTWKLDLKDAYREWDHLAEYAKELERRMEQTVPFLGTEETSGLK